jgi:hypothetical protein
MADDDKKTPDEEYKGISSSTAMWGGRATIESTVGAIGGAAVGAGIAYASKKPSNIMNYATWGSTAGFGVGMIHGSIADASTAAKGEKQFAQNLSELKELRSFRERIANEVNPTKDSTPKR